MTDLERFQELYNSLGIVLNYTVEEGEYYETNEDKVKVLTLNKGENGFEGYMGFCSEIVFTMDGKYLYQGFWE